MMPAMAASMRTAAMTVTMTSTMAVYSRTARVLVFDGGVGPDDMVCAVVGSHAEEATVAFAMFGIGFQGSRIGHGHIGAWQHVVGAVTIGVTAGIRGG